MPTSSMQRATWAGVSSMSTPRVSTTSADPQREDTERLPCLATRTPAPATTNAVAVDTLKVPEASPPVPHVSMSISRSVPVAPTMSPARGRTLTTFWRITWAKPISSSTVSPFMRSAVRKAAIWALVAAPDMMASIAPAASMRVRSRRSTSARTASVMMGLVMGVVSGRFYSARPEAGQQGQRLLHVERLGEHRAHAAGGELLRGQLDPEAGHEEDGHVRPQRGDGLRHLPARIARASRGR